MAEDYEAAILARQERQEIAEDADSIQDECKMCELKPQCQKAANGQGEFPHCPLEDTQ